jgi:sugar lactone lactonase YvrE
VTVVAPDGEVLELIELDADANATNCCFDGDGALWVTDFGMDWETREGAGRLWRVETDATPLPVPFGPLPSP